MKTSWVTYVNHPLVCGFLAQRVLWWALFVQEGSRPLLLLFWSTGRCIRTTTSLGSLLAPRYAYDNLISSLSGIQSLRLAGWAIREGWDDVTMKNCHPQIWMSGKIQIRSCTTFSRLVHEARSCLTLLTAGSGGVSRCSSSESKYIQIHMFRTSLTSLERFKND